MIKTPTLFILGAGASQPFGYPTGGELRHEILFNDRYDKDIVDALNPYDDNKDDFYQEIEKFREAFTGAGVYSIDSFLEHRTEFMNIGKTFISRMLISCEKDNGLRNTEGNWYMFLFDRIKTSFEELGQNKISFITFNYDRSLEHFLFEAIQNQFGKEPEECAKKMESFPIVHLYGKLDPLPWQVPGGKKYSSSTSTEDLLRRLRAAPQNIKLISDERDVEKSEAFKRAYKYIQDAKRIFFLGFGFDETNLKRLNINLMKGKAVSGTAYNLEIAKCKWVKNIFNDKIRTSINLQNVLNENALTLLQKQLVIE